MDVCFYFQLHQPYRLRRFRIFDILKPWPIRSSQALPAGWGITIDDFLAAIYVLIISFVFLRLFENLA